MKVQNIATRKQILQHSSPMASFGVYVPDGSELLQKIKARADRFHAGRVSEYARAAIERDLGEAPPEVAPSPIAPDVMESLTRILCGHSKGLRMKAALAGVDQVQHLTDLLEAHLAELEGRGVADARAKIEAAIFASAPAAVATPQGKPKSAQPKR